MASKGWAILYSFDASTTDTLPLNHDFFRPLGVEHFYDSFALVSEIGVRREALHLFGLRADELLPDLHITRDGVLRIGLGAHQEHRVNHVARATDRTKVSADVIQLAAHEVDPAPEQAVSDGDASDSEGSESASDSDQNDPASSLVADAEQYELMQIAYAAVGKDFAGSHWVGVQKATEIGDGSREMAFDTVILLATNMCGPPGSGRMLLGSSGHPYYSLRITSLPLL